MAQAVRLKVTEPAFLAFCAALAHERAVAGAGPAARIGIGQRADALAVIAALNDSEGWLLSGETQGSVTAEAVFARNLAPILCESPAMQTALHAVLARDQVPGDFDPPLPHQTGPGKASPPEPKRGRHDVLRTLLANEIRWRWLRLRAFAGSGLGRVTMGVGGLAIAAAISAPWVQSGLASLCDPTGPAPQAGPARWVCPTPVEVATTSVERNIDLPKIGGQGGAVPSPGISNELLSTEQQLGPLDRALTALERTGFDRSPAQLAGHLAQTGTLGLDPALYLQAMLTRWPMAANRPIPRSRVGAIAVVNFGIAAAELEGDAGALRAIRDRLPYLMQPEPTGAIALADGSSLPDAPDGDEEADLSLSALYQIDPRLAQLSVDEVAKGVWLLMPALVIDPLGDFNANTGETPDPKAAGQQQQQQDTAQSADGAAPDGDPDLRAVYSAAVLADFAARLRTRFGVDPGFDPTGTGPVTQNGITAAIRAGLDADASLDGSFRTTFASWPAALEFAVLVPVALGLLWAVLGYQGALRRRLARWPRLPPPQFHLVVPAPDHEAPALSHAARRLAPQLRYTAPRQTASLDVEASLARTLKEGGFFAPVRRTRRDVALHVVLIHRRTLAEHEPRRIAALFGQLQAAGVSMVLYEYAADPSRLRPFGNPGGAVRNPVSLLQDFPDARLVVVTTGEEFVGAGAYGAASESVRALCNWPHRVVVTPVPVAAWGLREWALSARLAAPLARAAADGLPDLATIFPSDPHSPERGPGPATARANPGAAAAWLRRMRTMLLPGDAAVPLPALLDLSEAEAAVPRGAAPEEIEAQVVTLRRWLGPKGFFWLQACASYPVLRYPLTRWLGDRLFGDAAPLAVFAQLTRLPWFAVGRIPLPLARRLRQDLGTADAQRIEDLFTEFFARHAVDGPSPTQDAGRHYEGDRMAYEPDALSAAIPGARQLPAGFTTFPEDEAERERRVRLSVLADRGAVLAALVLLGGALWAVWPDRSALPLAPGAWVPMAGLGLLWTAAGMLAVVGLAALRRTRRALQHVPSAARRIEGAK